MSGRGDYDDRRYGDRGRDYDRYGDRGRDYDRRDYDRRDYDHGRESDRRGYDRRPEDAGRGRRHIEVQGSTRSCYQPCHAHQMPSL